MKKLLAGTAAISLCICLLQSCGSGNNQDKKDSVDSAKTVNDQKGTVDKDVSDFVAKAASGGMMEVQLGQYASQNAVMPRVKSFGAMMVTDHTKANEELKTLAAAHSIAIPTDVAEEHKKHMDDLMQKKGKDFDQAYVDMMIDDHKKDISEFQKAASSLSDTTIRGFAQRTLPVLQKHLDSINAIKGGMKK